MLVWSQVRQAEGKRGDGGGCPRQQKTPCTTLCMCRRGASSHHLNCPYATQPPPPTPTQKHTHTHTHTTTTTAGTVCMRTAPAVTSRPQQHQACPAGQQQPVHAVVPPAAASACCAAHAAHPAAAALEPTAAGSTSTPPAHIGAGINDVVRGVVIPTAACSAAAVQPFVWFIGPGQTAVPSCMLMDDGMQQQ